MHYRAPLPHTTRRSSRRCSPAATCIRSGGRPLRPAVCATVRLVAWTGAFGPPRIRACTVDYYVAVYAGVGVWDWLVAREVRSERETGAICAHPTGTSTPAVTSPHSVTRCRHGRCERTRASRRLTCYSYSCLRPWQPRNLALHKNMFFNLYTVPNASCLNTIRGAVPFFRVGSGTGGCGD